MANDLNNAPVVTEQDLNNADAVDQQGLTAQPSTEQTETLADGTDPNKMVKYSALKKATDEKNAEAEARKVAEEQTAYAQRQLELSQAQQQPTAQPVQQPQTNLDMAMTHLGVTTEDMYDAATQIRVFNFKDQLDRQERKLGQAAMANQQFMSTHNDLAQVVGSVNPTTGAIAVKSKELSAILAQKPHLAGACVSLQATYDVVMQERELAELKKAKETMQQHQNISEVDTSTLPMGGSAAGGGGGDVRGQAMMTREQVRDTEARLARGEL